MSRPHPATRMVTFCCRMPPALYLVGVSRRVESRVSRQNGDSRTAKLSLLRHYAARGVIIAVPAIRR